jgi:hypothetical protein
MDEYLWHHMAIKYDYRIYSYHYMDASRGNISADNNYFFIINNNDLWWLVMGRVFIILNA